MNNDLFLREIRLDMWKDYEMIVIRSGPVQFNLSRIVRLVFSASLIRLFMVTEWHEKQRTYIIMLPPKTVFGTKISLCFIFPIQFVWIQIGCRPGAAILIAYSVTNQWWHNPGPKGRNYWRPPIGRQISWLRLSSDQFLSLRPGRSDLRFTLRQI